MAPVAVTCATAPPSGVLRPSSVDDLSRLLRQSGLDLSSWGVAGSKSVRHLLAEINATECTLRQPQADGTGARPLLRTLTRVDIELHLRGRVLVETHTQVGGRTLQRFKLLSVRLREGEILADPEVALMVSGADGQPVRHFGILGFSTRQLSREDVTTASLESINLSTAGIFDVDEVDGIMASPLIRSSENAGSLPAMQFQFLTDPAELQQGFTPAGESFITAVRLSGSAATAFPEGIAGFEGELLTSTDDLQVVMVADTDLLSDRLWVQVQSFFGSQIASAFADNGSLVSNLVENLSGSSALIDVRSRGQFSRPFTVVEALRLSAEARYLQSAEDLQARLAETEQQLSQLQSSQVEEGLLTLSPEQEAALVRFQEEKLNIRKQLRDVRHQLDKDIEALGTMLKFINILLMPLLLTLLLLAFRYLGLGRRQEVQR